MPSSLATSKASWLLGQLGDVACLPSTPTGGPQVAVVYFAVTYPTQPELLEGVSRPSGMRRSPGCFRAGPLLSLAVTPGKRGAH